MWKEKLGSYFIDVSKYVLTGVVIASLVKDMEEKRILIYALGVTVSALTLIVGLLLSNKKGNNNKNK